MQEYKYICQWCSPDILQQKNKGRFREIKNYRDHFRKYHSDVAFSEFLAKVERSEPKWLCKICRKQISLGNQLRHQISCHLCVKTNSVREPYLDVTPVKVQARLSSN